MTKKSKPVSIANIQEDETQAQRIVRNKFAIFLSINFDLAYDEEAVGNDGLVDIHPHFLLWTKLWWLKLCLILHLLLLKGCF